MSNLEPSKIESKWQKAFDAQELRESKMPKCKRCGA